MLLFKIIFYILLVRFIVTGSIAFAQIEINNSIELTNDTSGKRQIEGLRFPNDTSELVNAEAVMAGFLNYYTVQSISGDTLLLSSPITSQQLIPGMKVNFVSPITNTQNVYIKNGANSPIKIKRKVTLDLIAGDIKTGSIISLVFDGIYFQIQNPIQRECPTGYTEVNKNYCIQKNESSTSLNFYDASVICQGSGTKLCTWGEWYYACQNSVALGLTNMTNNFEYIDSAANAAGSVAIVGNATCTAANVSTAISTLRRFRCCFSK